MPRMSEIWYAVERVPRYFFVCTENDYPLCKLLFVQSWIKSKYW